MKLKTEKLTISYGDTIACQSLDFEIHENSIIGIIGESGSGKTSFSKALLGLLDPGSVQGNILIDETKIEIKSSRPSMGWIPQDPAVALHPTLTIQRQMTERIRFVEKVPKKQAIEKAKEILVQVGLEKVDSLLKMYPHELSGGMKQRVLIAMALMPSPAIIIGDEIAASLDTINKASLIELLFSLQKKLGFSLIVISHDLTFIRKIADYVYVMHKGQFVEQGETKTVFSEPKHPYTKELITASYLLESKSPTLQEAK